MDPNDDRYLAVLRQIRDSLTWIKLWAWLMVIALYAIVLILASNT